jgi:ketosteroid isomerase-like protein
MEQREAAPPLPSCGYCNAMSKNLEFIRQGAEAWGRQDAEAFIATVSPDVEWEDAMFWTEPIRTYRGRTELREWFEQAIVRPWDSIHMEVAEITEVADDRVLVGGLLTARGRASGVETQAHGWSVFWFADGKITRRRVFLDRAEALEAAGLTD